MTPFAVYIALTICSIIGFLVVVWLWRLPCEPLTQSLLSVSAPVTLWAGDKIEMHGQIFIVTRNISHSTTIPVRAPKRKGW